MKFKIGDKVKLKNGLTKNNQYGDIVLLDGMIFSGYSEIHDITNECHYDLNTLYIYSGEMLELYEESKEHIVDFKVEDRKETSKRYNSGKVEMHTLPILAVQEMCKVGMYGAEKYDSNNWRKPTKTSQYLNCANRHLIKFMYGEDLDEESKCYHLAHAAWNCLALLEKIITKTQDDDRYKYEDLFLNSVFNLTDEQKEAIELVRKKKEK